MMREFLIIGACIVSLGIGWVMGFRACFDYLSSKLDKFRREHEEEEK